MLPTNDKLTPLRRVALRIAKAVALTGAGMLILVVSCRGISLMLEDHYGEAGWWTGQARPSSTGGIWVSSDCDDTVPLGILLAGADGSESVLPAIPLTCRKDKLLPVDLAEVSSLTIKLEFPARYYEGRRACGIKPQKTTFTGVYPFTLTPSAQTLVYVHVSPRLVRVYQMGPPQQRRGTLRRRWTMLGGDRYGIWMENVACVSAARDVAVAFPGGNRRVGDLAPGDVYFYAYPGCRRMGYGTDVEVHYTMAGERRTAGAERQDGPFGGGGNPVFEAQFPDVMDGAPMATP
jgi:hypothetical protein